GYEAGATWAIQQWLETPHHHPEVAKVDPARPERRTSDLPWEVCSLAARLSRRRRRQTSEQKSAEAVVADGEQTRRDDSLEAQGLASPPAATTETSCQSFGRSRAASFVHDVLGRHDRT